MPVSPLGIPKYTIQPPLTGSDRGAPSASVAEDTRRVFDLIEDERHLTALSLLDDVKRRLREYEEHHGSPSPSLSPRRHKSRFGGIAPHLHMPALGKSKKEDAARWKEIQQVLELLEQQRAAIEKLENRCRLFRKARTNLSQSESWIYASTHFGIKTSYRREEDESLSVKLEGEMKDVPLFEQICVLKEIDLHYKWSPFCSSSIKVADLDKLDMVGWFLVGMPNFGLARDGCFRAIGCDNFMEDGNIIIVGRGVKDHSDNGPDTEDTYLSHDPVIELLDIPPIPVRRGSGRMTIRKFDAMINVTSPNSAKTLLVANVDPNMPFLPQSLLEFVMKHLAGVLLGKLQHAAKKVTKNPVTNEHAQLMRREEDFYKKWLLPKFEVLCKERGWDIPHVAALELPPEQLMKDKRFISQKLRRATTMDAAATDHDMVDQIQLSERAEGSNNPLSLPANGSSEDSMSAMSGLTAKSEKSNWSSNPIVSYLKEMEEKIQAKKEQKIRESREMAADRLKPKSFPSAKEKRLEELRAAKARRLAQDQWNGAAKKGASDDSSDHPLMPPEILTWSQTITDRLHRHGPIRRLLVVTSLGSVMFAMLHPEFVARFSTLKYDYQSKWWILVLEDMCTVLYLAVATLLHFSLCDAALVYAFDSLEVGKKAGWQIKRYYSRNVRVVMAGCSFLIFAISVFKALGRVFGRLAVWCAVNVFRFARHSIGGQLTRSFHAVLKSCPNSIGKIFDYVWQLEYNMMLLLGKITGWIAVVPAHLAYRYLIRSNIIGRYGEYIIVRGSELGFYTTECVKCYYRDVIETYENGLPFLPWRAEAFDTARVLFSYTAVFLVTSLVLFNLTARSSQSASTSVSSSKNTGKNLRRDASSLSGDGEPNSTTEPLLNNFSARPPYMSIPEDREWSEAERQLTRRRNGTISESTSSSGATGARLRRWQERPKNRAGENKEENGQPYPAYHRAKTM